jgi:X-Pro dipeptidyl-peptidase
MRRRSLVLPLLAAMVMTGLVSAVPAHSAPVYGNTTASYIVPTKHGKIYLEIEHATLGGKIAKVPTILTYSPYSVLGRNGDASTWNPKGYHRAYADVVGTGNSGGCYDYGGKREKETGYQIVEWIAKQKWSNGKVAMIGGSYDGTTATATAVMQPPHLTTIVPEAAISRWYGYAFSGGIRYLLNNESPSDEGVDTPLAFDFGLALPPPLDADGPDWAERVQSTITPCDELEHTQNGYDDTPDYGKFWLERDYMKDASKIRIPVLVAHNWGDWNVKQEEGWNLFHALKNARKRVMYFGTRYSGHGTPGGEFGATVVAWMDHYLKGIDNGIEKLPSVVSQTSDYDGPLKFLEGKPKTKPLTLIAQQATTTQSLGYKWQLLPGRERLIGPPDKAFFQSANANTESHANHHGRNNHDWFWFESPVLTRDLRIFGQPKVKLYSTVFRKWVTFTPLIVDVNPKCHDTIANQHYTTPQCTVPDGIETPRPLYSVTRGWLDSRYRNGLKKQAPDLKIGKPFSMTIVEKPTDYTFRKGHYIALNISTEINEWSIPKPYPNCGTPDCVNITINWQEGKTRVILPAVNMPRNAMSLFTLHGHHH